MRDNVSRDASVKRRYVVEVVVVVVEVVVVVVAVVVVVVVVVALVVVVVEVMVRVRVFSKEKARAVPKMVLSSMVHEAQRPRSIRVTD